MGQLRRLSTLGLWAALALAGCGKKRSLELPPSRPLKLQSAPRSEELYTADGKLKGSSVRVEWLEIPLAFRKTERGYDRHVIFEAKQVSMERAREFFAERMLTGQVDDHPRSVFYPAVMPPSGGDGVVRLDVRLTERGTGMLELDIERRAYDAEPLSFDEAKRALQEEQKHAH